MEEAPVVCEIPKTIDQDVKTECSLCDVRAFCDFDDYKTQHFLSCLTAVLAML